jgi:DNA polymerase-1
MGREEHILVDGNGLAYRSLFAQENLSIQIKDKIVFTGMPYGFLRALIDVKKQLQPDEVVVFWDSKTKRKKDIYPEYKANRKLQFPEGMEYDDVQMSMRICRKIMRLCGIPQYMVEGEEADDLISTYTAQHHEDTDIVVFSSDHDFYQLLRYSNVRFLKIGHERMDMWIAQDFINKFKFRPEYYPHYLAMIGDKTDNIPGIKGVGKKTADKLFEELSPPTLKNLYTNLSELSVTPKMREKIAAARKDVSIFLRIIRLATDLELTPIYDEPLQVAKLTKLLQQLQFRSILNNQPDMDTLIP